MGGLVRRAVVVCTGLAPLHDLADTCAGHIEIETVDITEPAQIAALHDRLADRMVDLLFVNAGVTTEPERTVAATSTDEFTRVMVTNALGPLRVIEALQDHVEPAGELAEALGFRLGGGRGKVLSQLRADRRPFVNRPRPTASTRPTPP